MINKESAVTVYMVMLFLATTFIWWQIYTVQFLPYDENYGAMIAAVIVSVGSTIIIQILWMKFRSFIKRNALITIVFLVINSPVTIVPVLLNYKTLFGFVAN